MDRSWSEVDIAGDSLLARWMDRWIEWRTRAHHTYIRHCILIYFVRVCVRARLYLLKYHSVCAIKIAVRDLVGIPPTEVTESMCVLQLYSFSVQIFKIPLCVQSPKYLFCWVFIATTGLSSFESRPEWHWSTCPSSPPLKFHPSVGGWMGYRDLGLSYNSYCQCDYCSNDCSGLQNCDTNHRQFSKAEHLYWFLCLSLDICLLASAFERGRN